MKTSLLLMAQYDGLTLIPVAVVCRAFFPHLTVDGLLRKASTGAIVLPVVRMDRSQKPMSLTTDRPGDGRNRPDQRETDMSHAPETRPGAPPAGGITDPVVAAIGRLLLASDTASWCGTATELLEDLMAHAPRLTRRNPAFWPQTPMALGRRIESLAADLVAHNLVVTRRNNNGVRALLIGYRSEAIPAAPSAGAP